MCLVFPSVTGDTENSLQTHTRQALFSDLNTFQTLLAETPVVGRCDMGPPGAAHPSSPAGPLEKSAQSRDSSPGFPDKARLPRFRCEFLGIYVTH